MDDAFLFKSMFTWYKEMMNLDQEVSDETIIIAAQAICEKMGHPEFEVSNEWVSKFKDRYGIKTATSSSISAIWRAHRRKKMPRPEPSKELLDKRARLGKSYAIDEESDAEVAGSKEQQDANGAGSDTDSLCGFSFEELSSVPEYKPHCCEHCSERYLWGHQLREHMKCHSDVKRYLCTTCGKNYKSRHNLKIHMRVHTGDRPYVCPTCEKGFREHSALVKHKRIHTGERPFLCSDCGSAFISKTQLNIHVRTHHSDGSSPPVKRRNTKPTGNTTAATTVDSSSLLPDSQMLYSRVNMDQLGLTTPVTSHGLPGLNMDQPPQPPLGSLLPGTGFYIPSTSAGSISCGTPMVTSPHQPAARVPDSNVSKETEGGGGGGPMDPAQVQMAQDFLNSAAQAYMYQDYYYNS